MSSGNSCDISIYDSSLEVREGKANEKQVQIQSDIE